MERDVLIGVDGGTGGIRVALYDFEGQLLGYTETEYETIRPHYGWAEQRPGDWWEALKTSVHAAMKESGIPQERILGISTATTCCSAVLCMRDGTPVRNSLIWMDVRSFSESKEIAEQTGEHLSAEWMPCKLLWLKRNEPDNYQKAEVFCEYQDWLTYKLTGQWSININTACNWGYNNHNKGFPKNFYECIGIPEAISKFPSDRVFAVGDTIGFLSPSAALELGLSTKTIVAQGGVDSSVGILGMGVSKKGEAALMTGSSNLLMVLTDKPVFSDCTINIGPDHLYKGLYTAVRGQVSTGSIMAWFKREFCKDLPSDRAFQILDQEARNVPAGSEGLLVLDYWQGNRQPHYDTKVRGMIYGYSLDHTRAHVFRALMEGIAYGTENLFKEFRESGITFGEISVSGGTAQSDLFLQIYADVSNVDVRITKDPQSVCLGCAICVAAAAGIYSDLKESVRNMVRFKKVVKPDQKRHDLYKRIFGQYACLYPEFKDWMHKTTDIYIESMK